MNTTTLLIIILILLVVIVALLFKKKKSSPLKMPSEGKFEKPINIPPKGAVVVMANGGGATITTSGAGGVSGGGDSNYPIPFIDWEAMTCDEIQKKIKEIEYLLQTSKFIEDIRKLWEQQLAIGRAMYEKKCGIGGGGGGNRDYLFISDYEAEGTNIVPDGMEIPNFMLKYKFIAGDKFSGKQTASDNEVEIYTDWGTKIDGEIYKGACVFIVPTKVLA